MTTHLGTQQNVGGPYFWLPLGTYQLTATQLASAVSFTFSPASPAPHFCLLTVATADVYMTDDGSTPSSTNGITLTHGLAPFPYYGDCKALKFIAVSGSPVLNGLFYR